MGGGGGLEEVNGRKKGAYVKLSTMIFLKRQCRKCSMQYFITTKLYSDSKYNYIRIISTSDQISEKTMEK